MILWLWWSSKCNARLAEMLKMLQFNFAKLALTAVCLTEFLLFGLSFLCFVQFLKSILHFHFGLVLLAVHLRRRRTNRVGSFIIFCFLAVILQETRNMVSSKMHIKDHPNSRVIHHNSSNIQANKAIQDNSRVMVRTWKDRQQLQKRAKEILICYSIPGLLDWKARLVQKKRKKKKKKCCARNVPGPKQEGIEDGIFWEVDLSATWDKVVP